MTLTEYMNQVDPARMPKVILTEGEFIVHDSIKQGVEKLTFIEIPAIYKRYGCSGSYIQMNNDPELYAMSDQGNIRRLSCFRLPTKVYYSLPLDGFNQPNGHVREIELTEAEYAERKKRFDYIYDNIKDADRRAQD